MQVTRSKKYKYCIIGLRDSEDDCCPLEDRCRHWDSTRQSCTWGEREQDNDENAGRETSIVTNKAVPAYLDRAEGGNNPEGVEKC